jgi:hypothetical protein
MKTKSSDCPRWHSCSAALCPLDFPHQGYHRNGERICYYLLESHKDGADERFADDWVFHECKLRLPFIAERYPSIQKAVDKAARLPSRRELATKRLCAKK